MAQNGEARRQIRRPQILEHFDDAAVRGHIALRPLGDFDDDIVAVLGAVRDRAGALRPNTNDRDPPARRRPCAAGSGVPDAADARRRIGRAADQARDAPSAFVHADGEHLDAVAVHQRRRVGARQHQGRRTVVRHHQHFAVGAAAHPARHPLALARGRKAVRPLDRLAVAHHRRQTFREASRCASVCKPEPLGEARRGQRLGRLRQVLEQQLAARDGIRVAHLLELEIRILARANRGGLLGVAASPWDPVIEVTASG